MKGENDFASQLWPRRRPRRWSGRYGVKTRLRADWGRDALTRDYTWLRSGGGGVAFGDGNPFEPLA